MSDLISRQAAIDALQEKVFHDLSDEFYGAMQVLDELPSADRPRGEWVEDTYGWVYCSHCKKYLDDYQMVFFLKPFDYCPNCGCRMIREDGEA